MNKSGNVRDILLISILVFVTAFIFYVGFFVYNSVADELLANPMINSSNVSVEALQDVKSGTNSFDYVVLFFFVGLSLALIITGWFIGGYPIFMIFYFFVMVVVVLVSMILSNVWENMSSASVWGAGALVSFPITNFLVTYLPVVMSIVGFLGMVAMFAKPYVMGGGDRE